VNTPQAFDTDQAKALGIGIVIAVIVIGLIAALLVRAIVGRIIALVVMVAIAALVWTQRASIEAAAKKCDATFFGIHLTPSDSQLKQKCQELTNR
jgi:hypothetical protein